MGILNFESEPHHRQRITDALRRRGLVPDLQEDWEIHGPHHPEMPHQVYVGYAISKDDPSDSLLVSIALHGAGRGVYEIDDPSDWYKSEPEKKVAAVGRK